MQARPKISSPRKLGGSTSRDRQAPSRSATWPCYPAPLSPDRVHFPRAAGVPGVPGLPRLRCFSHSEAAPAIQLPHTPFRRTRDLPDPMASAEPSSRTLRWVLEQQHPPPERRRATTLRPDMSMSDGHAFVLGLQREAERRMEEERARMCEQTARREADRKRVVQEDVRRIQLRIRRGSESARMEEVRRQAQLRSLREMKNRNIETWREYEAGWAAILEGAGTLSFRSVPWPMFAPPHDPSDITVPAVAAFLFSTVHSANQTRRERLKTALLRWHPDRFARTLARVADEDYAMVEESVNAVARCLNELMAQETAVTIQPRASRAHV